ncbi:MAG: RnfABCDGE type electron transport complex subunit A [Candidatus Krumholzibacteria bacterium]|jgi:electron transport complex protein RnfA|nr:RnfABCDGE type electron transport complex subunit A [Candidatus Krumholzibacteria bacterium]
MELFGIFITAALINNFVLSQFLGICPFVGVSGKLSSATSMGMATTFVLTMSAMVTFVVQHFILVPLGLEFLQTVAFILVIASLVQFVEMVIKKVSTALYRALGIFLPLITTNCAIMGLCIFAAMRDLSFLECIIFAIGAGTGFTLALVLMAGIREELELAAVPRVMRGAGITLLTAGILALGFMGFAGMKF